MSSSETPTQHTKKSNNRGFSLVLISSRGKCMGIIKCLASRALRSSSNVIIVVSKTSEWQ